MGRVPKEKVARLRSLMEETVPLVEGGRFIDIEAYTKHNEAFHNAIIELANNPTLTDSYARLGVSGLMVSLLREGGEAVRRSSTIIGPSSMHTSAAAWRTPPG